MNINKLVNYCNDYLDISSYKDYCPNGLQIQGSKKVKSIVMGVTACQDLIDIAVQKKVDAIFVHHGFFWKGEEQTLTGMKYKRVKSLIQNNINLVAYHLPLDAHKKIGNNILFAKQIGLNNISYLGSQDLLVMGEVKEVLAKNLSYKLTQILQRKPLHIAVNKPIKKIALCTGAAQSYIYDAIKNGADAFISGEISESTVHIAKENNIHYFAAGHHATERFGIRALGEHLQNKFNLQSEFIDINNPV